MTSKILASSCGRMSSTNRQYPHISVVIIASTAKLTSVKLDSLADAKCLFLYFFLLV